VEKLIGLLSGKNCGDNNFDRCNFRNCQAQHIRWRNPGIDPIGFGAGHVLALHRYKKRRQSECAFDKCLLAGFTVPGFVCRIAHSIEAWPEFLPEHRHFNNAYRYLLLDYGFGSGSVRD